MTSFDGSPAFTPPSKSVRGTVRQDEWWDKNVTELAFLNAFFDWCFFLDFGTLVTSRAVEMGAEVAFEGEGNEKSKVGGCGVVSSPLPP